MGSGACLGVPEASGVFMAKYICILTFLVYMCIKCQSKLFKNETVILFCKTLTYLLYYVHFFESF